MPWPWPPRSPSAQGREPAGLWDCHVHILPGIDDGPRDMATAVAMVAMAAEHGTAVMVATPHAIEGLYDTDRPRVLAQLEDLRAACGAAGLAVRLLPGQEIALVPDLPARLTSGRLLTLGDLGRAVLIEVPSAGLPPYWEQSLFDLAVAGFTPVVAHVERTPLLHDERLAERAAELGCRFQINARVLGTRGGAYRACLRLVAAGWVAALGSDGHDLADRPPVLDACLGQPQLVSLLQAPAILPHSD